MIWAKVSERMIVSLTALRRMMPPPIGPDVAVDWGRMSRAWGKQFPADYRQFMDVYGPGTIAEFLVVKQPEPREVLSGAAAGGMVCETANAEAAWTEFRKEPTLAEVNPMLIAWAVSASADILCWDSSGDDPDGWPVLVWNRDDTAWRRYDCGMVEFLRRVLEAEFEECPLSGTNVWGIATAKYLTFGEETRLRKAGFDPWTGEPDPYAGMFPM
ncbi:hypothetical protein ACN26Z_21560 [Verrucosispora sp. WMMD703]|uniref:hypothetical protein n=1 Tax=Verrucosispora sp. WMMD703 TaxID=3403463 RepID=UPI003B948690